jgi:Tfp pilus assembly protein PilP
MSRLLLTIVAVLSTAAQLGAQTAAAKPAPPAPAAAAPAKPGQAGQTQPAPAPAPTPPANAAAKPAQTTPPAAAPQPAAPAAPTTPGPAAAPAPAPAGGANAAAPAPQAIQPEPYTYNPDGRRDPFTNLIGTGGSDSRSTGRRGDGPAGMAVADVTVRGVLQSRGALIAMIQGPDNKTYIVHQGDKLLDGVIKTITPQGLIVTQEVNDPLSLVKQREVSKLLRSLEVVKP